MRSVHVYWSGSCGSSCRHVASRACVIRLWLALLHFSPLRHLGCGLGLGCPHVLCEESVWVLRVPDCLLQHLVRVCVVTTLSRVVMHHCAVAADGHISLKLLCGGRVGILRWQVHCWRMDVTGLVAINMDALSCRQRTVRVICIMEAIRVVMLVRVWVRGVRFRLRVMVVVTVMVGVPPFARQLTVRHRAWLCTVMSPGSPILYMTSPSMAFLRVLLVDFVKVLLLVLFLHCDFHLDFLEVGLEPIGLGLVCFVRHVPGALSEAVIRSVEAMHRTRRIW